MARQQQALERRPADGTAGRHQRRQRVIEEATFERGQLWMREAVSDPDLAGVRDKEALEKLPEAERKAWARLWVEVEALRVSNKPTIPSRLGDEKAANPFLRADVPEVAKAVGLAGKPAWQVFAEVRERKNRS